jgi:hypothetical protein
MSIDPNSTISMIGVDGGVKYVPSYMREELLKKGWKVVSNPKMEYYPQYDRSLQGFTTDSETVEEDDNNFLEVKII